MADFKNVKDRIDEDITENGKGLITGNILNAVLDVMLDAIGAVLDLKVDAVEGKGLSTNDFTNELKNKLNNMPYITGYDAANDRITIGSKTYQLTEYVPVPDYYIGWTTGNKSAFNALSDLQIAELAGQGKYISTNPTYTRAFGTDTIFFLLYKSTTIPSKIIFTSSNQPMQQDIVSDNNFGSHADVEIGEQKYKLFGIYMSGGDPTDSITIQYQ